MRRWLFMYVLLWGPVAAIAAPPAVSIKGQASVIDGDTVEIHGVRIRLHGIDAPESGQSCRAEGKTWRCGQRAALALSEKIRSHVLTCDPRDRDRYGRIVAVCRAGGEDLNAWLVAEGWALAYRAYSQDYAPQEASAQSARRGVWAGEFVKPWEYRRGVRLKAAANDNEPGQCLIKGNISKNGARIYHVPGGQFYGRAKIDTATGERWFCTEADARKAGWRRSTR